MLWFLVFIWKHSYLKETRDVHCTTWIQYMDRSESWCVSSLCLEESWRECSADRDVISGRHLCFISDAGSYSSEDHLMSPCLSSYGIDNSHNQYGLYSTPGGRGHCLMWTTQGFHLTPDTSPGRSAHCGRRPVPPSNIYGQHISTSCHLFP